MKDYMQSYFNEISKYPILTEKEEKELYSKMKKGDEKAREKLITSNMRLVFKIANEFKNKGVSFDDLIQVGNIGLIEAVDKFDINKSNESRFATYAQWWIKCKIKQEFKNSRVISFDNNIYNKMNKAKDMKQQYGDSNETAELIAKQIRCNRINYAKSLMEGYSQFSLNEKINDESVHEIIENIDDDEHNFFEGLATKETVEFILKNYKKYLSKTEQIVFEKRFIYDFIGCNKMTQKELAEELGYTHQMIGVLERKVCDKLKEMKF